MARELKLPVVLGQAERIRQYLCRRVEEKRRAGETSVILRAGDIHSALGLENAMPNVCQVLKGKKLHEQARVESVEVVNSPPSGSGSSLEIAFKILQELRRDFCPSPNACGTVCKPRCAAWSAGFQIALQSAAQ